MPSSNVEISAEFAHDHNFTYSASGATITATCSAEDCPLPEVDGKHTATLTIGMPTESSGGKAVLTSNPEGAFGDLSNQIQYQKKNSDGTWSGATTSVPTTDGFYKASITLGTGNDAVTASVTYGTNCITYDQNTTNGSIGGPSGAVVGATVTPGIKPAEDYELDTLTVTPAAGSGVSSVTMTEDGKGFIMPLADVTVSATFKKIEYAITTSVTGGTLTVTRDGTAIEKPNKGDTIMINAVAAEGYDPDGTITVTKTGDKDTTVMVTNNTFTMPDYPVTVTATFTAIDYSVTVSPATNGTVTADKTSEVHVGDEVTLTVSPAADYLLDTLTVTKAGGGTVAVTNNQFTMPADNVTVSATFKKIAYTVTPDGATATATDNTPAQNKYTATLEVSDKDYDGEPVQARVTTSQGFPTDKVAVGSVTYKDASGQAVTSPTNVGKYTASVAVGDKTISRSFEIKALPTVTYSYTEKVRANFYRKVIFTTSQYILLKDNPEGITFLWDGLTYVVKGDVKIGALIYVGKVNLIPCKDAKLTVYAGIYHIGSELDIYTEDGGDNAVIDVTGKKSLSAFNLNAYSKELSGKTISGEGASVSGNIRIYSGNVNISKGTNAQLAADDINMTLGAGVVVDGLTGGTENEDGSKTYTSSDFAKVTALSVQPVAVVGTAPTAKTGLTHSGTAQALLDNGGEAIGGTMQYALGDAATAPATGWDTKIPTGTTVGTYYVWYGAKGDANHRDSEPAGPLTVTIAAKPDDSTDKKTVVIGDGANANAKDIDGYLAENDDPETLTTVTEVKIEDTKNLQTLSGIEKLENVEKLTISGADSLKDISAVKELGSLKTLDVSNCSSLETADLSGNQALETLSVENCPSLVSLDVSNGSLAKLEVRQCNNLKQLDCSNNQLGQLDAGNSRLPGLSDLWCSNQQISGWTAGLSMDLGQYAGTASVNVAGAATLASTGKVLAVKATDSQGDIAVNYTPGGSTATFARTPEKVTYWYDTGFNNVSMDVTVSASGAGSHDGPTSNKGGGGCDTFSGGLLALAALALLRSRRR